MTPPPRPSAASPTTVDDAEVARFSAIAAEWWDPAGKFRPLHGFNPVRIEYIKGALCRRFVRDPAAERPLEGLRLLDIGCGGGLMAEPMARLGATVTAIDASERNIKTASVHARESRLVIDYRIATAESLLAAGERFDAVLSLEVIEHVADVGLFLACCADLVAPGGQLFLATLNRTPKSYLMAIIGAEYVLGWLPRGTHDWKRFQKPSDLAAALRERGLAVSDLSGVIYNPFTDSFRLDAKDIAVNYLMTAERAGG